MIVLDASAAVELLAGSRLGRAVAARIRPPAESLHAPVRVSFKGSDEELQAIIDWLGSLE